MVDIRVSLRNTSGQPRKWWMIRMYLQETVQPVNFKRFYGRYGGLIEKHQWSVKEMVNDL